MRILQTVLRETHGKDDLLNGAVTHLLKGETMVNTNAPSSVHIWISESHDTGPKRYVVSLVNLTGGPELKKHITDFGNTIFPSGERFG